MILILIKQLLLYFYLNGKNNNRTNSNFESLYSEVEHTIKQITSENEQLKYFNEQLTEVKTDIAKLEKVVKQLLKDNQRKEINRNLP